MAEEEAAVAAAVAEAEAAVVAPPRKSTMQRNPPGRRSHLMSAEPSFMVLPVERVVDGVVVPLYVPICVLASTVEPSNTLM